jgi:UDP-sugar transporter A1/2/3
MNRLSAVLPAHVEPKCTSLRMITAFLLLANNSAAYLLLRFTRTRQLMIPMYSITALVFSQELFKLVLSTAWLVYDVAMLMADRNNATPDDSPQSFCKLFLREVFVAEAARMLLPAVLFTIQNSLLVVALENLDATVFQIIYQGKTCIVAILMVLMLGRSFSRRKWACMCLMISGVVLVQLRPRTEAEVSENNFLGLVSVAACALTSAFAGVYMELEFKDAKKMTFLSARNLHLSSFSVVLCLIMGSSHFFSSASTEESTATRVPELASGTLPFASVAQFFAGFDLIVWIMVANHAFGGLLVAVLLKYADNMVKTFATTLAIIASGTASFFLFGVVPGATFVFGGFLVIVAVICYNLVD